MAAFDEIAVDEEQLLVETPAQQPRRLGRATLVAGGLAAAALVAVGASRAARGPVAVAPEMGAIGMDELPSAPTRKSFVERSVPYMGGRDFGVSGEREQGKIKITEDGVVKEYFLPGATTIDDFQTVEFRPPYRFYLMKEPTVDYSDESKFYKPQLIGKTFTVDMNLNGAGCGCNLNFYLVDMPVKDAGKDGDHYCDAQCFDGLGCCSEFDMNEGNNAVQQVTNHACSENYEGHPDWKCHKWGEPLVKTHETHFGVSSTKGVDSSKPFTFSQRFDVQGEDLIVTTTITQGDAERSYKMGPNEQLNYMWKHGSLEEGMVFVTGYWHAPDMNWLDGETCGSGAEHCNENPAYISNWRITTNGSPVPSPAPVPEPVPSPSPAGGKCRYGGCGADAHEMEGWCHKSEQHCAKCNGGKWCA